ncbi:bacteriocin, lactococcin 972 family protein [Weissella cibaria]|uniref:bacteriocin, lactococcin 972 family protein n=1 Tax=Weissella cibaria TaxID=137591 RepID=UPI001C1F625E|nr:bacteriocin, lactococcin 972 family protein [Weissella cibaria]MBU7543539.1 bacteriocin, lactococcin 972 family protein [Weissella cibaria]MCV3316773.1 bacteriocin, lactococcin 972 family protein [Weissella cibaria]
MSKFLRGAVLLSAVATIGGGAIAETESAATQHPHPTYKDTWNYGTNGNHWWSYYFLEAPVRLGSSSSVKNTWGTTKAHAQANYGWVNSDATKDWNDGTLNANYGWYNF